MHRQASIHGASKRGVARFMLAAALGGAGAGKRIVHGRCAAIDPAWMEEDVEISWQMTKERGLEVDVRQAPPAEGVVVAENSRPANALAATARASATIMSPSFSPTSTARSTTLRS